MRNKNLGMFLIFLFFCSGIILPSIFVPLSLSTNLTSKIDYSDMNERGDIIDKDVFNDMNFPISYRDNINSGIRISCSKFDKSLIEYLGKKLDKNEGLEEKIRVIISFEGNIEKLGRINVINSFLKDFQVIKNYNIIKAVYLYCKPSELISAVSFIEDMDSIKKIYKEQTYTFPVITDNYLELASLNSTDYGNWWLGTVGARNLDYDGEGVRVAVLDSGIYEHPDLTIVDSRNFVTEETTTEDLNGHGTHVAGIIGSNGGGSDGKYAGIAPGVELINARVGDSTGTILTGDVISAIEWCVESEEEGGAGADIISMSFGGGYPDPDNPMTDAISKAVDQGVICVASAGNSGPGYFTGSTPAAGKDVIAVGATDNNDDIASFSSWGPTFEYLGYPDVLAPGVNIISTEAPGSVISSEKRFIGDYFDFILDADYIPLSGTSMSCPLVSGTLAILKEAYPYISPETTRIALIEGAYDLPQEDSDEFLKTGAGIINVSESLMFLENLKEKKSDMNNVAIIYPNELPFPPHDLIHFPGDYQELRLTVISGKKNNYNISLPSGVEGVSLSLDSNSLSFSDPDTQFFTLKIRINNDAKPGIRTFQIKLTNPSGSVIYDTATVQLEIRLPEYKILMDSYHGLNDWYPEVSFHQIGFYDAIKQISLKDISIDYQMEYWTPNYDPDLNNSILTQERLSQYDLVILQNPILPYSPLEIENLKNYFDQGGSILFLGTRYQDLCVENIDYLFSKLNLGIEIASENLMDVTLVGLGASIDQQAITELNSPIIFDNVSEFSWYYGNAFSTYKNQSIATKNGLTVVAIYNQTTQNRGKFVAFGDMHWLYENFQDPEYSIEHKKLLDNLLEYLLKKEDISLSVNLPSERTTQSRLNISVYIKDQATDRPIQNTTILNSLNITIVNGAFEKKILFTSDFHGIAINDTYELPFVSSSPYTIKINLTYNSHVFEKITELLYYNESMMPKILSLGANKDNITRAKSQYLYISTDLDQANCNVSAFLSIYSYSFFNEQTTVNKTYKLNAFGTEYNTRIDPSFNDPSGYAFFYIIPKNATTNLINPYSPRDYFWLRNNDPNLIESNSTFKIGNSAPILFNETSDGNSINVYSANNGTFIQFQIDVNETVSYEEEQENMRVLVNLFKCIVTEDGYLMLIYPKVKSMKSLELTFNSTTDSHEGNFTIPKEMLYDTISGKKWISTETTYQNNGNIVAVLYISVLDGEGGYDSFIIILTIDITEPEEPSLLENLIL
ncbi:MAG: S8 family peptidase, partial [Promethearchaeota archaeon]